MTGNLANRMPRLLVALSIALTVLATPAAADPQRDAVGAIRAVFYHELGHALVDLLDLDIVGAEETVVDEFSTMLLILRGRQAGGRFDPLLAAARFWYLAADPQDETARYWTTHDFSRRRGFNIVCLLHGSDPDRFFRVMAELGVAEDRRRRCEVEYREKAENWINILSPHTANNAPAGRRGRLMPSYEAPARADLAAVAGLWQREGLLEALAAESNLLFPLPVDVPVRGRECGEANAYWTAGEIIMCYELHAMMVELFLGIGTPSATGGTAEQAPALQAPARSVPSTPVVPEAGGGAVNIGSMLGSGG
ncbi:MAG: DUF4344 domain-containing metallopeptidase [Pikeienuella sp.]